jgi:hypothetical protein
MNLPTPFANPTTPHARRHGPQGYKDYQSYKLFLRDDFTFRCVYCLERETWYPNRADAFSTEHFEPKVLNPDRERDYENLVYACTRCNSIKREKVLFLDPTLVALADHLRVAEDGQIEGLTPEGKKLIALLDLAHTPAVEVREETLLILRAKREQPDNPVIHEIFLRRFRYPTDLPDLTKAKPPGGNSRPDGIEDSHHMRRRRGELPEVY